MVVLIVFLIVSSGTEGSILTYSNCKSQSGRSPKVRMWRFMYSCIVILKRHSNFQSVSIHLSKVLRVPRKSEERSYEVLHLSWHAKQRMLQNATPLRKSAPWPPNISDEDVSCTVPAARKTSLQILFKRPTPGIMSENAAKTTRLAHFWQSAESRPPATKHDAWTSKAGPNMWCLHTFDFDMCFAPQLRALFPQLNFQKWFDNDLFLPFNFEMCLAPPRRALFEQLNCQKCLEPEVFQHFALEICCHNGLLFFNNSISQSAPTLRCCVHFVHRQWRATFHVSSHLTRWLRTGL